MSDFFGGHCWQSLAMNSYNKRNPKGKISLDDILVLEWSFFGVDDGSQTKTVTGFLCTPKRIMFQRFFLLKRIAGRATHIRNCMGNQVQFFAIHPFCGCCLPIFKPLTHPGIGRNPLSHYTPNNGKKQHKLQMMDVFSIGKDGCSIIFL